MNKKIKKTLIILFVILSILGVKSYGMVRPTSDFYVNDYANLLSEETKNYIIDTNKNLYSQTGAQIVVVTIPSLEGNSLEDYATQLFRNFGIGDKTKNNGVLLLLALQERKFRVEVGYGLEGILPDGKTGRIQDEYIIPYLKNDNWNEGIRNGFSAILEIVANEYHVNVGGEKALVNKNNIRFNQVQVQLIAMSMVISMSLGTAFSFLKRRKKFIFSTIYMIILIICAYVALSFALNGINLLVAVSIVTIINLGVFMVGLSKIYRMGGFSSGGGGFSGGGFSSGGRWFFWWRRKLEKFLMIKTVAKVILTLCHYFV